MLDITAIDYIRCYALLKMRKTIQDVKIGEAVSSGRNGKGMVTNKTKRTVTVTFENGNTVKNTYRYNDDYFYGTDF